jgi:hypothetical protein
MVITAKFASTCPSCSKAIAVGSKVEWEKGSRARHVDCSSAISAISAPTMKPGTCARCGASCKAQYRTCFACSGKSRGVVGQSGRVYTSALERYRTGDASARSYGWDGVVGSPSYYTSGAYDDE